MFKFIGLRQSLYRMYYYDTAAPCLSIFDNVDRSGKKSVAIK